MRWRRAGSLHAAAGPATSVLVFATALMVAVPADAQVTFPSAAPVSAGNVVVRLLPSVAEMSAGGQSLVDQNVLLYGASPYLTFILKNNSFVSNSADSPGTSGRTQTLYATGFGDSQFEARYMVYEQNGIGSTMRIAPYVGVFLPTGMQNADAGMPRYLQPALGEWGGRAALTWTWQTLFWNTAAQIGYETRAASGGFQLGDKAYADASLHYLLWPRNLEGDVEAEWFALLESNYSVAQADRSAGGQVPGTGGQLLLLDPGMMYSSPRYSLSLLALLPAMQQNRGPGGGRYDYGFIGELRLSFYTYHHW